MSKRRVKRKLKTEEEIQSNIFTDMYIVDKHDGPEPEKEDYLPSRKKKKNKLEVENDELYEYDDVGDEEDKSVPLFAACREGDLKEVIKLVKQGISVNSIDLDGETPLHEVSKNGNVNVAKFLLSKGAKVDAVGLLGLTPLHNACRRGYFRLVQVFCENGGNVNKLNRFDQNALHFACESGNKFIIEYLMQKEVKVNQIDCLHRTPLHVASENGFKIIVKYLLLHGSKMTEEDIEDHKPEDVSKDRKTKALFEKVTAFKFSFGQNETNQIESLKKELSRYKKMYEKTMKLLAKKESDVYNKRLKKFS